MNARERIIAAFSGQATGRPLYLPNLTLWYDHHRKNGTLPPRWQAYSLAQIADELDVPLWQTVEPVRNHAADVQITTTETDGARVITSETSAGKLTARWIVGPDGAMWQTEYPVKEAADLDAVLALVTARLYSLDPTLAAKTAAAGDNGVVAVEIPRRPLSDLLHEYLGWAEGLMLFLEEQEKIAAIIAVLEDKLQAFVDSLAAQPHAILYSPDNLDGQFISPRLFQDHLAGSYRRTADAAHAQGKRLVVHVGGPARRLLAALAETGIDVLEGVAGPPQSDADLDAARQLTGPGCTLWGGIAQDHLVATTDHADLEEAIRAAVRQARHDARTVIGIADRVPVEADLDRLRSIRTLVEQNSWGGA